MRRLNAYKKFIKEEKTIMCRILTINLSSIEEVTPDPKPKAQEEKSLTEELRELYKVYGTYKEVASRTGFPVETVKEFFKFK